MQTHLRNLDVTRSNPASRIIYRGAGRAVVLRPTTIADAETIAASVNRSLPELKPFMPWAHGDTSVGFQLERLKRVEAANHEGRELGMGLFDEYSGEFLAGVGLHPRVPLNPNGLEVGYWTPTPHTRKGYATLAARLAIAYAFELLECSRLQVSHDEANAASRRVVEKCGFHFEGKLRNAIARPAPEVFAGGYCGTSISCLYALVPEDRASLDWYRPLIEAMTVENLVGYPVPFPR